MNIYTHSQTVIATKTLVKEFKKSDINEFRILSLMAKIDCIVPLQKAEKETMDELKYAGRLILLGVHVPSSILYGVPHDIFTLIFNLRMRLHENTYQKLLKITENHTSNVQVIRTRRGYDQ
jgi:hypothetical protein